MRKRAFDEESLAQRRHDLVLRWVWIMNLLLALVAIFMVWQAIRLAGFGG